MEKERGRQTCVADDIAGFGGYAFPPVKFTGLGERWMAMERKEEGGQFLWALEDLGVQLLEDKPTVLISTSPPSVYPVYHHAALSAPCRGCLGLGGSVCSSRQHVVGSGFLPLSLPKLGSLLAA